MVPGTHRVGDWVGHSAGFDASGKRVATTGNLTKNCRLSNP